jgi:hypothetical protein
LLVDDEDYLSVPMPGGGAHRVIDHVWAPSRQPRCTARPVRGVSAPPRSGSAAPMSSAALGLEDVFADPEPRHPARAVGHRRRSGSADR